ncbi:MAG: RDD family protein [Planctomycetota bacterium]
MTVEKSPVAVAAHTSQSGAEEPRCPICLRMLKERWLRKPVRKISINDVVVCKKCRNGFASRRQLAYIVDAVILQIVSTIASWLVAWAAATWLVPPARSPAAFDLMYAAGLIVSWIIWPLLFCCKDGFAGMSPGKVLCGIRAIDWETWEPIGFGRSLKRNLCLMIPFVPLILAVTLIKGWRWGDKWARTRVIWKKYEFRPPFDPRGILCLSCGYDLTGNLSGRCPECGTLIAEPRSLSPVLENSKSCS